MTSPQHAPDLAERVIIHWQAGIPVALSEAAAEKASAGGIPVTSYVGRRTPTGSATYLAFPVFGTVSGVNSRRGTQDFDGLHQMVSGD